MNNLAPGYAEHFGPTATFEQVWSSFSHMNAPGPFLAGSEEAQMWANRKAEDIARRSRKWIDQYPPLVPEKRTASKRRMEQTVLKPMFETLHDIRLRLDRSLIFIGTGLFLVMEIREHEGDFAMVVCDDTRKYHTVMYGACPDIDLRSPEAQYITFGRQPVFMFRPVGRSQRQGLTNENLTGVGVWPKVQQTRLCDDIGALRSGLRTSSLTWSPPYEGLMRSGVMPSLRLSKELAVYFDGEIKLDFRNRPLGVVKDDNAVIGSRDLQRPWIVHSLNEVGLRPQERS